MSGPATEIAPDTPVLPGRRSPAAGRRWFAIAGLCLVFIVLRWRVLDAPLIRDEGEYAYSARLLEHGLAPYEHSFLQKPPMIVYTYLLADVLAPGVHWVPRVLAYLSAALSTLLLGYVARVEFGRTCAWLAMFFFTPMVLLPRLDQAIANTEMFLLCPLLGLVALFVRTHGLRGSLRYWSGAGVLAALALGYKYTCAPLLAAVFAAWSWREWHDRGRRTLWRCWLAALCAAGVSLALIFGYFLLQDGGRHVWECTVTFNQAYAESGTFTLAQLGLRVRQFWADWWLIFLALPFVFLPGNPRSGQARDKAGSKPWLWLGLFLAAWASTGASYYSQYYVTVMPFWALLAALAVTRLGQWLGARFTSQKTTWDLILGTLVTTVLCMPDLARIVPTEQQRANERFDPINPFPESRLVAQKLAAITSPQDYVFVAGSEPQILYYADRVSASRFVITYPLMIPSRLAAGYQQEAVRELEQHPPAAIVRSQWSTSWLKKPESPTVILEYLNGLLARDYERIGGYVLGEHSGSWVEPLPVNEVRNASLLLYRKKTDAKTNNLVQFLTK